MGFRLTMRVVFETFLIVQKKLGLRLSLLAAVLCLGLGSARASTFLELQSTYLGNGWFQYRFSVMNDRFFTEADITKLYLNFTNQIDQMGDSTNWSYATGGREIPRWLFTNGVPARPYTTTFLARSSETAYRLGTTNSMDAAEFGLSVYESQYYPGQGGGGPVFSPAVGFVAVPCLIPCRPEDADGSPTNFVYDLKLLPDIQINQLIEENGVIYGVEFTYAYESTFLLQGSPDLNNWTNIAYIWSYPQVTDWFADETLNSYGQYFRLALVAGIHTTNLPPLSAALSLASKPAVKSSMATNTSRVTGCQLASRKVVVSLATQAGQTVLVQAVDSHRVVKQTQLVVADGASATVSFDAASLPNPAFFQAVVVP
jgi:hypothetical protein